jgi:hypothetical protein
LVPQVLKKISPHVLLLDWMKVMSLNSEPVWLGLVFKGQRLVGINTGINSDIKYQTSLGMT